MKFNITYKNIKWNKNSNAGCIRTSATKNKYYILLSKPIKTFSIRYQTLIIKLKTLSKSCFLKYLLQWGTPIGGSGSCVKNIIKKLLNIIERF